MERYKESFLKVSHLILAKMNYNWTQVERCVEMFPAIRELSVSFNVVSKFRIPPSDSNLMKLRALTLEGNLIEDWNEVLKLGSLPW